MAKSFDFRDLIDMRSIALSEWKEIPPRFFLYGADRPLTVEEQSVLAYYKAALSILVRKGAIKQEWMDSEVPLVDGDVQQPHESLDEYGACITPENVKKSPR